MANKEIVQLYGGDVQIIFYPDSHRYKNIGSNDWIASVTGICGILDKSTPFLLASHKMIKAYLMDNWKDGVIYSPELKTGIIEEAIGQFFKKRDKAADSGTLVHEWCASYIEAKLNGLPDPVMPSDETILNGAMAFLEWVNAHHVVFHASERMIYSKEHNYVGLLDAIATVDGKKRMVDFKTGAGVYPDHYFQVSAYRAAYEEETGEKLENSIILHFNKETGEFTSKEATAHDEDFQAFVACLLLRKRTKELTSKKYDNPES